MSSDNTSASAADKSSSAEGTTISTSAVVQSSSAEDTAFSASAADKSSSAEEPKTRLLYHLAFAYLMLWIKGFSS